MNPDIVCYIILGHFAVVALRFISQNGGESGTQVCESSEVNSGAAT